jgi:hypothetical protein
MEAFVRYRGNNEKILNYQRNANRSSLIFISVTFKSSPQQQYGILYNHYLNFFYNNVAQYQERRGRNEPIPEFSIFKGAAHTVLCYMIHKANQISLKESNRTIANPNDVMLLQAAGTLGNRPRRELYAMYERLGFRNHVWARTEESNAGYAYLYGTIKDVQDVCNTKPFIQFVESNFDVFVNKSL